MKRMRFLVAILIIWLFFFYNIERLSKPVNLSNVAYTLVPTVAVTVILVPRLHKVPLGVLLTVTIVTFLTLKLWLKGSVWGPTLPLTVTEGCTIALTIILARRVSNEVSDFERVINRITIGQADELSNSFSTGQVEMYRELRRARRHQRPLALVAIGVEEKSIQVALDRIVQEVQQAMMKRYVLSEVARALCDELQDHDIIAHDDGHFLVLLPEVTPEELTHLVNNLREVISERIGVIPQIGTASFPDDAVTFDSLVKQAMGEMERKQEPKCLSQSRQLSG